MIGLILTLVEADAVLIPMEAIITLPGNSIEARMQLASSSKVWKLPWLASHENGIKIELPPR